jgi:ribosomal protein L37AE/L43A
MSESPKPEAPRLSSGLNAARQTGATARMICERCGQAEMFRMHAVWRCPNCGYKTDCCGW